jgi:hypothetical protein
MTPSARDRSRTGGGVEPPWTMNALHEAIANGDLIEAVKNIQCHKHGMGECYPTKQREKHWECFTGFVLAHPDLVLRTLDKMPCPHSMVRLDCESCLIGALLRLWKADT